MSELAEIKAELAEIKALLNQIVGVQPAPKSDLITLARTNPKAAIEEAKRRSRVYTKNNRSAKA